MPNPEARPHYRYNKPVIASMLAGLAVAGGWAGLARSIEGDHPTNVEVAAPQVACAEQVSSHDLAAVDQLIDGPAVAPGHTDKYGLHLHTREGSALLGGLYDSSASFSTYLGYTKDFFDKYGVKIVFKRPGDRNIGQALDQTDLGTPLAKENMLTLIDGLSALPEEYVQLAGLKKVLLLKGLDPTTAAETRFEPDNDTIAVDMTKEQSPTMIGHETYHLVDLRECGEQGSLDDPQFAAINPDKFSYGDTEESSAALYGQGHSYARRSGLQAAALRALYKGDDKQFEQLMDEYKSESAQVLSLDDYGLTKPVEDKAVEAAYFGSTALSYQLDPNLTVLRAKTELMLARLYKLRPRVAKYFIEVARVRQTQP